MTTTTTAAKIVKAIVRGQLDAFLPQIADACVRRREAIGLELLANLEPGMRVRFKRDMRPKKLGGRKATVVAVEEGHVFVDLDYPVRRNSKRGPWHKNIGCPPSILEVIQDE